MVISNSIKFKSQKSDFTVSIATVVTSGEMSRIDSTDEKLGIVSSVNYFIDIMAKGCQKNWVVSYIE